MFRNKKASFECTINIQELSNLPFVSGDYYIKWKLKNNKNSKGFTLKKPVQNHTVIWDAQIFTELTLFVGKDGLLLPCEILLSIKQEVNGQRSVDEIGTVTINLSEFANQVTTTRKYLLQDSKVNSVLRVTVSMKQVRGDEDYLVPATGSAMDNIQGVIGDTLPNQTDGVRRITTVQLQRTLSSLSNGDEANVDAINGMFGDP